MSKHPHLDTSSRTLTIASAQVAKREARSKKEGNTFGNPIKATSKVLAVLVDPTQPQSVFTAESGGRVARYNLEVGKTWPTSVPLNQVD